MNAITAFVDASNVYGSDQETANSLRDRDGKLKVSASRINKAMLPNLANDEGEVVSNAF